MTEENENSMVESGSPTQAKKRGRPPGSGSQSVESASPAENKTYRVIKGQVGPWNAADPTGNSFSMSQFKAVTALPSIRYETAPGEFASKTIIPPSINVETYWDSLIERLVTLNVIRHEPGISVSMEIPLGPECGPRYAMLNQSAQIALNEAKELVSRKPLENTLPSGERQPIQRFEPSEIGAAPLR